MDYYHPQDIIAMFFLQCYQVYRMTPSRGRALVINNSLNRSGSTHDYENVTTMLRKFGFIISGESDDKDWRAQVKISHCECTCTKFRNE